MLRMPNIYQFKSWRFSLFLGNITKCFTASKKSELNGYVYDLSVNYGTTDISDVEDILKSLMKMHGESLGCFFDILIFG